VASAAAWHSRRLTRGRFLKALLFLVALLAALPAAAQGNVIRIVVPFAAGGVQDIVARSFNAELGAALGRSVIVENRPGAGGTVGTGSVAKSSPTTRSPTSPAWRTSATSTTC
jgi:tripartite-type tricarboxylate transporter receptor subunit TctC